MPKTLSDAEYNSLIWKSKTGWAKYYELLKSEQLNAIRQRGTLRSFKKKLDKSHSVIPTHLKTEFVEMMTALGRRFECCICMCTPSSEDVEISKCGHRYCKPCLSKLKEIAKASNLTALCAICRNKMY
uniref:RING-type domain-containing protein n=1 Tax=viral metagenome TaxID=1070528 RepID=A0A6C0KRM3_9ZZZZ